MTTFFVLPRLTAGVLALALLFGLSACSQADRVVYLGSNTTKTLRLREPVKGVKVWYKDSTGVAVPGVADLPEGGYFRADLSK